MKKTKKILLTIAILLIITIPLWLLLAVPKIEEFTPQMIKYLTVGQDQLVTAIGEDVEKVQIRKSDETITQTQTEEDSKIKIHEQVLDTFLLTKEKFYEHSEDYEVDKRTYEVTGRNLRGQKLRPNVQPTNQENIILLAYLTPLNLEYKDTIKINHINAYKFEFTKNRIDTTGNYPTINAPTYQNSKGTVLVEPISGYVISYEYYFDAYAITNNQEVQIEKGYFKTTPNTITARIRIAEQRKRLIYLLEYIVPISLLTIATALLVSAHIAGHEENCKLI